MTVKELKELVNDYGEMLEKSQNEEITFREWRDYCEETLCDLMFSIRAFLQD